MKRKIKKRVIDERFTTITGAVLLISLIVICILGIINIDVFISTSVFPCGLIFSKDSWFGIKTKK